MREKNHVLWHKIQGLKSHEHRRSLRWHVLNYIQKCVRRKTDDEVGLLFHNLFYDGARSGMIEHLNHYSDVSKFFIKYYKQIEDIRKEWESNIGKPFKIEGDLKFDLACFAFDNASKQIINELDINVEL